MEKVTKVTSKDLGITKGYYIELECCMCGREQKIAAETKKQLIADVKDGGWKILNSDQYRLIGHYDGCDYLD